MNFGRADDHPFRLCLPLPEDPLSRGISVKVFQVDEQTHAVVVHPLEDTQLPTGEMYDTLRAEVFDDVSEMGFCRPLSAYLIFDFAEPLCSGFRQLADLCRGRLSSSLPPSSSTIQGLATAVQASTGVALLETPSIRDVLLFITVSAHQTTSKSTPQIVETLVSLASMGPPSDETATYPLRAFIQDPRYREDVQLPQVESALIGNHWRSAKIRRTFGSLFRWTDADFANGDDGRKLEQGTASLLRTLVDTGFVRMPLSETAEERSDDDDLPEKKNPESPPSSPHGVHALPGKFQALARKGLEQVPRTTQHVSAAEKKRRAGAAAAEAQIQDNTRQLLDRAGREGNVRVLKQIVGPSGIFPVAQLPKQAVARLLLSTVELPTYRSRGANPERDSKLVYLLADVENGGVGVDPNVAANSMVGSDGPEGFTQTALHIAMHIGDTQAVDLLLQYGARSDIRDEKGRLPRERSLPGKNIRG